MKYHLNIQSILKITAFQNEEVYSSWNQVFWFLWCSDQHCWIFCRKYYLHVFSPFSVLLSNLSITECIFNIIVTSFKSRQFLYQLHIWYCMFPTPPPPPPPCWIYGRSGPTTPPAPVDAAPVDAAPNPCGPNTHPAPNLPGPRSTRPHITKHKICTSIYQPCPVRPHFCCNPRSIRPHVFIYL